MNVEKVRVSHLLVKHEGSRRPTSWKDPKGRVIRRTSWNDVVAKLKVFKADVLNGKAQLVDLVAVHSNCNLTKWGGDLEHKYKIVKCLQDRKHICGMTGDGVNDAPTLKKANIGIAVTNATDAAWSASDIVPIELGFSVIISVMLTSRAIFQRMKNYTLGFLLLALIWKFDFSPFMVLIIAILDDGGNLKEETYVIYMQVSIVSQALIFVTQSRTWSFVERPGLLLMNAFVIAQLTGVEELRREAVVVGQTPAFASQWKVAFAFPFDCSATYPILLLCWCTKVRLRDRLVS